MPDPGLSAVNPPSANSLSNNLPQCFDRLTTNGLNPFALSLSKGLDSNIVSLLDGLQGDAEAFLDTPIGGE